MDRLRAGALAVLAAVLAMGGCSTPAGTFRASEGPAATAAETLLPTMDIEQPGQTASRGQTDTEWGPIWNEVPPGFPEPPGATPAEADDGPVSAASTVPAGALPYPLEVAQFYVDAFAAAGYGGARDGPLEDGSSTAWASNGYGCDIRVTAVPRGGEETFVTVLYGAGCPFDWPVE
jgi:hypothetical protein